MKNTFLLKLIILELFVGTLAICAGTYYQVYTRLNAYQNSYYNNVTIGGINVGNLSLDEAYNLVLQDYINPILESELSLVLKDSSSKYPLKNFIATSNLDEVLKVAYEYPNTLNLQRKLKLLQGKSPASFEVNFTYNEQAVWDLVNSLAKEKNTLSQNATISIDSHGNKHITPHQNAYTLDKTTLAHGILNLVHKHTAATLNLEDYFLETPPSTTLDYLEAIDTLVASYSTKFNTGTGNATNITLASQSINGILLEPGDIFSFNTIVGDTTLDKGYTYAPVIANSKVIQGVGGGVCQVSSTLYNAILMLGLSPLERRPHSMPSSYVPLGQDATIDWGTIDFKFENTLAYPIYIVSYTENGTLYVDLYSHHSAKNITYKLISIIDQTLAAPTKYIGDASLPKGTTKLISSGSTGYKVTVKREGYHHTKLISSEIISHDIYAPSTRVYKVDTQ